MNYALLANSNQARRLSALNTSGTNPQVNITDTPAQRIGRYAKDFVGDIPMIGGTYFGGIFTNLNMPKDQVLILDMDRINFKVMRKLKEMDAANPGEDVLRTRLLMDLTVEIKNAKQTHAIITGLTV